MPFVRPRPSRALRIGAVALFVLASCGGGGGDEDDSTTVNDTSSATGADTSSGGASTDASATSTSASGPESSSTDPTGLDSSSGTDGWTYCDPQNSTFTGDPRMASINFDFDARTCATMSGEGGPPQLQLEIQNSGLIDATAYGVEITDASAGLLFEDPPSGDSQVIDLYPGFVVHLEGTIVSDGTPIIIEFEVTEKGPLLDDARADFG